MISQSEHLTLRKVNILDLLGITPKRLANAKPPKSEGCIYGAMTNILWRTKGIQSNNTQIVTAPGQWPSSGNS